MKHNPRVNERVVMLPGLQGPPPAPGGGRRAGRARADVAPAGDPAEVAGLDACSLQPAAGSQGELTGPDADARLLRGPRRGRAARHDHHRRHRARDEPGERDDGGLQAGEGRHRRARQPRPRRSPREGERAHRRADADEPVDARALRRAHRGGREDLPRRRLAPLLRRREPERRLRDLAAGRHGLRHRPHQPAQDVLAAARRRRPRRRARSSCASKLEPFLPVPGGRQGRRRVPARPRPAEVDRQGARLHAGRSASSSARTPTSARTGRRCARCPRSRC